MNFRLMPALVCISIFSFEQSFLSPLSLFLLFALLFPSSSAGRTAKLFTKQSCHTAKGSHSCGLLNAQGLLLCLLAVVPCLVLLCFTPGSGCIAKALLPSTIPTDSKLLREEAFA